MLLLLGVLSIGVQVMHATVLTVEEQSRIKDQLSQNLPGNDVETTYYGVSSLKILNSDVPKEKVTIIEGFYDIATFAGNVLFK